MGTERAVQDAGRGQARRSAAAIGAGAARRLTPMTDIIILAGDGAALDELFTLLTEGGVAGRARRRPGRGGRPARRRGQGVAGAVRQLRPPTNRCAW